MPLFARLKSEKTSVKKKKYQRGFTLRQSLKNTLGKGTKLREAILLPPQEDLKEWIAMLTVENFNSAAACWAPIGELCNPQTCPKMTASPSFVYLWQDDNNTKPVEKPACEYVELLMKWINTQLDNEMVFPSTSDRPFGKQFLPIVKKIWKRLFRVFFHIYYHHWKDVQTLKVEAHINTAFKSMHYASQEFGLVPDEDLQPVKELLKRIPDLRISEDPKDANAEGKQESS